MSLNGVVLDYNLKEGSCVEKGGVSAAVVVERLPSLGSAGDHLKHHSNMNIVWNGSFPALFELLIVSRGVIESGVVLFCEVAWLCVNVVRTEDHSSRVVVDQRPIWGLVSFIRRGGLSLGVGGGIIGRELVWPFFVSSLLSFLSLCQLCSI